MVPYNQNLNSTPYERDRRITEETSRPSDYLVVLSEISAMINQQPCGTMNSFPGYISVKLDGLPNPEIMVDTKQGIIRVYHKSAKYFAEELSERCQRAGKKMRIDLTKLSEYNCEMPEFNCD